MTTLDLPNIQGFVIRGYRLPYAAYLFLRIDDAARARALLGEVLPQVITAARWTEKPESGINVAVSHAGLRALGVASASLDAFPEEFRVGMAARAERLADTDESAPEHWEPYFRDGEAHVLVMVSARDEAALRARDERLRTAVADAGGLTVVGEQQGAALEGGREHFGYADGFAQPSIEGSGFDPLPGAGAPPGKDGTWRPLPPGEFVLGYPDEQNALAPAPPPDEFGVNGSYLVYRKLAQDVAGFRRALREAAEPRTRGGEELLAAKLVGRWRDGTPLDMSPHRQDPALVGDAQRNNAFDFRDGPGRPALPGRRARAADEPAPQPPVRRQAREPPPADPARDHLRRAAARGRGGRRARARRDLHVPAGERRAPVRVRPVAVGERRQRVPARAGPGPDRRPARHRRPVEARPSPATAAAVLHRPAVARRHGARRRVLLHARDQRAGVPRRRLRQSCGVANPAPSISSIR